MDRHTELRLIDEALANPKPYRGEGAGSDHHSDVRAYLDEDRFKAERELVFRRNLNFAAHATELPNPGDFVTRDIVGSPVIIARGGDGTARAFLNVCRHRGATVELRERGQCKTFVCPYHAWVYGRDGALKHARHADGFPSLDKSTSGLVELACEEVAGFIWVCPDRHHAPTLDDHQRALLTEIEAAGPEHATFFARDTRTWRGNWKLFVEGGIESYHFKSAHRDTVGPLFTDTGSTYESFGDHMRMVLPRTSMRSLAEVPEDERRLLEHANMLYMFHPNTIALMQDGHYALIVMTPEAVDATRIEVITIARAPKGETYSDGEATFLSMNHAFTKKTLEEDFVLGEQIQRGLSTGANTQLLLATFEHALHDFTQKIDGILTKT